MKPSLLNRFLNSFGGLSLAVGALLWPTVSQAQGFCYIVDTEGRTINLDDLCASDDASRVLPPQSETTGADSAQPAPASQIRGFTIIGTPTGTDPSESAADTPSDSVDADSTDNGSTGEEATDNESMNGESAGNEPTDSQSRPGIPVEEITVPGIEVPQIQTPGGPNSSTSDPETNDSETNGSAIRNSN